MPRWMRLGHSPPSTTMASAGRMAGARSDVRPTPIDDRRRGRRQSATPAEQPADRPRRQRARRTVADARAPSRTEVDGGGSAWRRSGQRAPVSGSMRTDTRHSVASQSSSADSRLLIESGRAAVEDGRVDSARCASWRVIVARNGFTASSSCETPVRLFDRLVIRPLADLGDDRPHPIDVGSRSAWWLSPSPSRAAPPAPAARLA